MSDLFVIESMRALGIVNTDPVVRCVAMSRMIPSTELLVMQARPASIRWEGR